MKRKILIGLVSLLFVVSVSVSVNATSFSNSNVSNDKEYNFSLKLHEKLSEKIGKYKDNDNKIIFRDGDISISDKEVDFAKLDLQYAKSENASEKNISDSEAIDYVYRRKILIRDAKNRGVSISSSKLNESLLSLRKSYGVSSDGKTVSDENLSVLLKSSGINHEEYEKILAEKLEYSLLYYNYAKLLYQEIKQSYPDVVFDDSMVYNYIGGFMN